MNPTLERPRTRRPMTKLIDRLPQVRGQYREIWQCVFPDARWHTFNLGRFHFERHARCT